MNENNEHLTAQKNTLMLFFSTNIPTGFIPQVLMFLYFSLLKYIESVFANYILDTIAPLPQKYWKRFLQTSYPSICIEKWFIWIVLVSI